MGQNAGNYRIVLAYEGTRYDGWQKQGNTEKTIQGKLEAVLEKYSGQPTEVHGSGRTDAGVHARGQAANFRLEEEKEPEEVMAYLNRYLPEDIAVLSCEKVSPRFHSRLNAVRKIYCYQLEMGPKKDVFQRNFYYGFGKKLDVGKMKKAAAFLVGTHDFKSFCGNKKMKKSTVRTLERIDFQMVDDTKLHIFFTGNGFLQQMVRILVGTLIEVGEGKRAPEEMKAILEAKERSTSGFTAPSQGLFLMKVEYGEEK